MKDLDEKYGALWTKDETILCFYLYSQIPFSKTNKSNPEVVRLAKILGRTVGSVVRKLGNLGAVDDRLRAFNIKGLTNFSKLDKIVFDEFVHNWEGLISVAQGILSNLKSDIGLDFSDSFSAMTTVNIFADFTKFSEMPTSKVAEINVRIRQSFFRRSVLSNYDGKCCISGLDIPELVVASHIIPWAKDLQARIDPRNGLALSCLHDKAFDLGLITITPDYRIQVSKKIYRAKSEFLKPAIFDYSGKEINIFSKFLPKQEYLSYHNKNIFQK